MINTDFRYFFFENVNLSPFTLVLTICFHESDNVLNSFVNIDAKCGSDGFMAVPILKSEILKIKYCLNASMEIQPSALYSI